MTVFDIFQQTPYTFLTVVRGAVKGNVVTEAHEFMGVVKIRDADTTMNNIETPISSSTIHAHPEDILSIVGLDEIVGQGIFIDGVGDFEITNCTTGINYDNGQLEHLTLTLQRAHFIDGIADNNSQDS